MPLSNYDPYREAHIRANRWGDTSWIDPRNREFRPNFMAMSDPVSATRSYLANAGHTNRLNNPWFQFLSSNVSSGLPGLYHLARNTDDATGFNQWAQNVISGGLGPSGAGTVNAGAWMSRDQAHQLMQSLATGQGLSDQVLNMLLDMPPSEISDMIAAAASMYMTPQAARSMGRALAEKASDYSAMLAGGITDAPLEYIDFLRKSGFFNVWF